MEYFQHIHPTQQPDGTLVDRCDAAEGGALQGASDFLPGGGAVQFLAQPLVTAGYTGDLAGDSAHLVPDTVLTRPWTTSPRRYRSTRRRSSPDSTVI